MGFLFPVQNSQGGPRSRCEAGACKAPTAPWGSGTEGSLTENVFGLICCLQRKLPAAGSHAEIRQAFICSTPACLEKYVINASKCSFITVRLFFVLFYFGFFLLWHEQCWQQNPSWGYWEGICAGWVAQWLGPLAAPHFSVEGRVRGVKPRGIYGMVEKLFAMSCSCAGLAASSAPLGPLPGWR